MYYRGILWQKRLLRGGGGSNQITVDLGKETVDFLFGKVRSIATIYTLACILLSAYFLTIGKDISFIIERLPSLFLLQRSGFVDKEFIGLTWYISSMLLCMAIIYPILRKFYNLFTNVYGALFGIFIIGYLIYTTGYLGGVSDWAGITYKCNLRALGELCLGTTCFEVGRRLSEKEYSKGKRIIISSITVLSAVICICSTCSNKRLFNDGIILMVMCCCITMLFVGKAIFQKSGLYDNAVLNLLGELSMPIYILQNVFHYWVDYYYYGENVAAKISIIYFGTLLFSLIFVMISRRRCHLSPR